MRVLVVGNGSREHALCWKLSQSPRLERLWCAPGNAGTRLVAENVDLDIADTTSVACWCVGSQIDLVVIGPEVPLAAGLGDALREQGLLVFGPSAAAAQIESSKIWSKEFCHHHQIPTGRASALTDLDSALSAINQISFPVVIKADGLAAGKGVAIVETRDAAESILRAYLIERELGDAGSSILIEEFLDGPEVSLLAFSDGERFALMPPTRDHKRIFDGDQGPNTGGMGAIAPVPEIDSDALGEQFIRPALQGLREAGHPFIGVLYAGLMLTSDGPKLIEYNCRFGDPETQVILPLLDGDLLDITESAARGSLDPSAVRWRSEVACGVVMASHGYPGKVRSGDVISGLDQVPTDVMVFHAGTSTNENDSTITSGGRVLTVVGMGENFERARERAYTGVRAISFDGAQVRTDIGLTGPNSTMTGTST